MERCGTLLVKAVWSSSVRMGHASQYVSKNDAPLIITLLCECCVQSKTNEEYEYDKKLMQLYGESVRPPPAIAGLLRR